MADFIDTIATVVLLVLIILLISHMLNGDAMEWIKSKFTVAA